jgi:hypothetical protein
MNIRNVKAWRLLPALVIVVSLLLSSAAMAKAPESGPTPPKVSTLDAASPTEADDGALDVGAEAQGDVPPAGPGGDDLPAANGAAWSFYSQMRSAGYTGAHDFFWTNQNSWEIDWKRAALGGIENDMVDNVDIAYYHDHGNGGVGEWFPWDHTDNWLVPNDCLNSYGDKDLEWAAIGGCSTLSDALLSGWASCLNGAHLLLGYKTTAYDGDWGGIWADQMLGWKFLGIWFRAPKTVTQAWFTQCDQTQPSGVTARVIAEDTSQFSDYLSVRGAVHNAPVNWPKWYLDHACYKPAPQRVDASILAVLAEVPSYNILDRNVTESYAQGIANSLGLEGQLALSPDGTQYALNDTTGTMTGTLSIEMASGGYLYQNLGQLWIPPSGPLSLPTAEQAVALGNSFLDANAQALPGLSNTNQGIAAALTEKFSEIATGAAASQPGAVLQSTSTDVMVAYGRSLSATGKTVSGAAVNLEVSVAGPGGTTKLYYGGQGGAANGATAAQAPIALAGGSRDVQSGAGVEITTADKAWDAFTADHQLAIVTVPLDADEIARKGDPTFAYYEQPHDVPQKELIPAWVFTSDFKKGGQIIGADVLVYVPASTDYYPPDVAINSPAAGQSVQYGALLNFESTVGGGFGPFTYEWSSSTQGVLGNQEDIQAAVTGSSHPGGGATTPVTIVLKATNENGQSRTAEVHITVVGPNWLPMIMVSK